MLLLSPSFTFPGLSGLESPAEDLCLALGELRRRRGCPGLWLLCDGLAESWEHSMRMKPGWQPLLSS